MNTSVLFSLVAAKNLSMESIDGKTTNRHYGDSTAPIQLRRFNCGHSIVAKDIHDSLRWKTFTVGRHDYESVRQSCRSEH